MSQHDFNIGNQLFPATRTDFNNALVALASNSSGATAPATTYANQWWYETDTSILKIRNEANTNWVDVIKLDTAMTATVSEINKLDGVTATTTEFNKLAGLTSSTTELNQLDSITRGSILYGNSSAATARLAKGSANTVLTSDGTDIAWAAPATPVGVVPTGTVIYHAANTPPTDFIKANGAAVSRSTYSALFTAIGTTFGTGDGSSTFNVPDLRGEFMRGWDDSRGVDSGRSFGSSQADEFESHQHIGGFARANGFSYSSGRYGVDISGTGTQFSSSSSGTLTLVYAKTSLVGDTETRPRNIALLACIKY